MEYLGKAAAALVFLSIGVVSFFFAGRESQVLKAYYEKKSSFLAWMYGGCFYRVLAMASGLVFMILSGWLVFALLKELLSRQ